MNLRRMGGSVTKGEEGGVVEWWSGGVVEC